MVKAQAIELLGGLANAANLIGVTQQAIRQWPETLSPKLSDRVQAALWRKSIGISQPPRKAAAKAEA